MRDVDEKTEWKKMANVVFSLLLHSNNIMLVQYEWPYAFCWGSDQVGEEPEKNVEEDSAYGFRWQRIAKVVTLYSLEVYSKYHGPRTVMHALVPCRESNVSIRIEYAIARYISPAWSRISRPVVNRRCYSHSCHVLLNIYGKSKYVYTFQSTLPFLYLY